MCLLVERPAMAFIYVSVHKRGGQRTTPDVTPRKAALRVRQDL